MWFLFIEHIFQECPQFKWPVDGDFSKGYARGIQQILEHAGDRRGLTVDPLNEWRCALILKVSVDVQRVRRSTYGT